MKTVVVCSAIPKGIKGLQKALYVIVEDPAKETDPTQRAHIDLRHGWGYPAALKLDHATIPEAKEYIRSLHPDAQWLVMFSDEDE
jgi:hypothetical protein